MPQVLPNRGRHDLKDVGRWRWAATGLVIFVNSQKISSHNDGQLKSQQHLHLFYMEIVSVNKHCLTWIDDGLETKLEPQGQTESLWGSLDGGQRTCKDLLMTRKRNTCAQGFKVEAVFYLVGQKPCWFALAQLGHPRLPSLAGITSGRSSEIIRSWTYLKKEL